MPDAELVKNDLAPVSVESDRTVTRWLVTCMVAVAVITACGAMDYMNVVTHPQWWGRVHPRLVVGVDLLLVVPFFMLLLGRHVRPELRLRLMNLPLLATLQGGMDANAGTYGLVISVVIIGIAASTVHQLRAVGFVRRMPEPLRIQPPSPSYQQPATR